MMTQEQFEEARGDKRYVVIPIVSPHDNHMDYLAVETYEQYVKEMNPFQRYAQEVDKEKNNEI